VTRIDNIKRRRPDRAALFLVPTLFALLGPAGVVAAPFLEYGKTQLQLADLSREATGLKAELQRNGDLLEQGTREHIQHRLQELDASIPPASSTVLLHALVRMVCRTDGIQLQSLAIGDPTDSELPRFEDFISTRKIRLNGEGNMAALVSVPQSLAALGFPNAVTSFDLSRSSSGKQPFSLALTLLVFESADPAIGGSPPSASSAEGI